MVDQLSDEAQDLLVNIVEQSKVIAARYGTTFDRVKWTAVPDEDGRVTILPVAVFLPDGTEIQIGAEA